MLFFVYGRPRERPAPIQNSTRKRVLAMVRDHPGLSLQEIANGMALTRTATTYHVRRLQKQGEIRTMRQGRTVRHFPPSVSAPAHQRMLGTLRLRMARAVVHRLAQDPTASWRSLARDLEIAPHTVRWHVKRLEESGLINVLKDEEGGHRVNFHAELRAALNDGEFDPSRVASPRHAAERVDPR
jgi:predicted transcriptional regulator